LTSLGSAPIKIQSLLFHRACTHLLIRVVMSHAIMLLRKSLLGLTSALLALNASAAVHYVSPTSTHPVPPYLDWNTAATNIQAAVDASAPGDQVLVTNGTYQAGARLSSDGTTNRVAVTNAIVLQSVNGAAVTTIDGGTTNRCVSLAQGAALVGFTLTRGYATNGAGIYCSSTNAQVFDCQVRTNSGKFGAGVYSGTLSNCTLTGNSVWYGGSGGGAYSSTLVNCTVSANTTTVNGGSGAGISGCIATNCTINNNTCNGSGATVGGGATGSTLYKCTLSGNRVIGAGAAGGGAYYCTLNNCTLTGNYADHTGGGAYTCSLTNCLLTGNNGSYQGGGVAESSTVVNCVIRNNTGGLYGGGVDWHCTVINCTIVGNSSQRGGGTVECALYNCICYYNSAYSYNPNTLGGSYTYSCTPDAGGVGNITSAPLFVNRTAGDLHLLAGSPGIDAGTNAYAPFTSDYEGNLRVANGTVDMGAYEFQQDNPMSVAIQAQYTNVVVGIQASFTGIFSRGQTNSWDFGDGTVVSNQMSVSHTWTATGDYPVTLTVFDSSNPGGVSATFLLHVIPPPLYYVDPASTNPVAPFSSWENAATNIQDAVDAAVFGAHIVVTNSVWQDGGRVIYGSLTNRLAITKPVVVESVHGPAATVILGSATVGDTAVRCVYLTNGATLSGFTLLNGATRAAGDSIKEQSGGGAWCESTNATVLNCLILSNAANVYGGGIRGGSLTNCSLLANATVGSGGAAYSSVLQGCLLSNNTAIISYGGISGGGASSCTLFCCMLVSNVTDTPWSHPASGGGAVDSTLTSCTLTGNQGKDGGGANNCTLRNCTLQNNTSGSSGGAAASSTLIGCMVISNASGVGGGVFGCSLTNCVLTGNNSSYQGGGASGGVLHNCLLTGNSAGSGGGAANDYSSTGALLISCTVVGNSAGYAGGGIESSTAWNSIIFGNTAPSGSNWNYYYSGTLNYCCTAPLPPSWVATITNAPLFADPSSGQFQLQPTSPCINAGTNAYTAPGLDLAGNPRIIGGTMDMGAYECQSPALLACYTWLQSYALSTYAPSIYTDADHDGMNNYQKWLAGTVPTNASSVLNLQSVAATPPGLRLRWNSDANHTYFVQRATSLQPASFSVLRSNVPGLPGTTEFTDSQRPAGRPAFYRIGTTNGGPQPRLETPAYAAPKVTLTWFSLTNRSYFVERSTNPSCQSPFSVLRTNIPGLPGTTSFDDLNPPAHGPAFYRIGVRETAGE
jgi:hypothetical protein